MQELFFTQIHLDELRTVISDVVKCELKNELQALKPSSQPSLPTLHEWTKEGKIPAYRIGTRVRFKRAEVEQSLNQIKTTKKGGYNA